MTAPKDNRVSISVLFEYLLYCHMSGKFWWRKTSSYRAKAGKEAGSNSKRKRSTPYFIISIQGHRYMAHRLAWAMYYGEWPDGEIDHLDGDGLNNRIENLRVVSAKMNRRNMKRHSRNKSGMSGVYWGGHVNKWYAQLFVGGKSKHLGCFDTFEEAAAVRKAAEREHGFTERHGL